MKIRHVVFILLFLILLVAPLILRYEQTGNKYINKALGYEITPPSGWPIAENSTENIVYFWGPYDPQAGIFAQIDVAVENTNLSLSQYVPNSSAFSDKQPEHESWRLTENITNISIISQNYTAINGIDCYNLVQKFTDLSSGLEYVNNIFGFVQSGKAYIVTYAATSSCYNNYTSLFQESLQTLRLETPLPPSLLQGISVPLMLESLGVEAVATFVIVAGILISKKDFEKHVKGKRSIAFSDWTFLWLAIPIFVVSQFILSHLDLGFYVMLFGSGLLTWVGWHFITPTIAHHIVKFRLKKSPKQVFLIDGQELKKFTWWQLLRTMVYPFLFMFAFAAFFMDWTGVLVGRPFAQTPNDITISIFYLSLLFLPVFSPLFVSTNLLFKTSGVRCFDKVKVKIETLGKATYYHFLPDFIGIGALLVFIKAYFQISDFFYILILFDMLAPVALLTTSLYVRFSISKNRELFLRKLKEDHILSNEKVDVFPSNNSKQI
jgi:hypothetical protein